MLIRISLIIAIVAGLAVAAINFTQVKEVISTTRETLATTSNTLVTTTSKLEKTSKELAGVKADLTNTKETLASTEEARDKALADATTSRKQATDLSEKLTKTTAERDDARANLAAWDALGIPVDQVKRVIAQLKEVQGTLEVLKKENEILAGRVLKLDNELQMYRDPEYCVPLPEGLKAKVLVSDPKWDFVVLDAGQDQGVLVRGELLINRQGRLIAKVRVLRVEQQRCIANVVPGWKIGEVTEGDLAIPAI